MFNKYKQPIMKTSEIKPISHEDKSVLIPTSPSIQKTSIISDGAVLDGNFTFRGLLHLDGVFKGAIKVDKITIGKSGLFDGKLDADIVVVIGDLKGEVNCRELVLNAHSSVTAKVTYSTIKMQAGSFISGQLTCTHKNVV